MIKHCYLEVLLYTTSILFLLLPTLCGHCRSLTLPLCLSHSCCSAFLPQLEDDDDYDNDSIEYAVASDDEEDGNNHINRQRQQRIAKVLQYTTTSGGMHAPRTTSGVCCHTTRAVRLWFTYVFNLMCHDFEACFCLSFPFFLGVR